MVLMIVGLSLTKLVRGLPRYQRGRVKADLLLVPVYAVIGVFLLMPLRLYSMITARRTTWGTRGTGARSTGGRVFSSMGTLAALALALSIPVMLLMVLGIMTWPVFPVAVVLAAPSGFDWDY